MIALAKHEAELSEYLERVVLLAPCFGISGDGSTKKDSINSDVYAAGKLREELEKLGIYATGTLRWQVDRDTICDELSDEFCDWAKGQPTDKANGLKLDDH